MADGTTPRLRARFAAASDIGLLRERNEDSYLVFPRHRFAAVADGMGGHHSGDVASAIAVTTLTDFLATTVALDRTWPFAYDNDLSDEENCVVVGVRLANQQVFGRAAKSPGESGMGTTVVAMMFSPDTRQVVVGHVGDSRCYRVRGRRITPLTTDHSLVSEVTEIAPWLSEDEIQQLPSNYITRALGMGPDVMVDLLTTDTRAGDLYLLCSDGLSGMLDDDRILDLMTRDRSLEERCRALIDAANDAGGADNVTVALAAIEEATEADGEPAAIDQGGAVAALAGTPELAGLGAPSDRLDRAGDDSTDA
ncbi:MAG: serine/threonine-protein phosphatase [Deltaproteobacteria bacterium]|nr:serine/threonine-protein phosphatase [Deltaproteobacteria bacterium]